MAKNIEPTPFPTLQAGDDEAKQKYVAAIYSYADTKAQEVIRWYLEKKGSKRIWAQALRFLAIALTTIGAIVPFLVAGKVLPAPQTIDYGQAGYVALALAGACIALDKFFGFSSAWMRYVASSMALHRVLSDFYVDWASLNSGLGGATPSAAEREAMLRRIQALLQRIMSEVERETGEWAAEYRKNLAEVEKSAREQLESARPGVLNLTVPNATQFRDGVTVMVDDQPRQSMFSATCQIAPVFAGDHFVRVKGVVNGQEVTSGAPVRVSAGEAATLTLTLPAPGTSPGRNP